MRTPLKLLLLLLIVISLSYFSKNDIKDKDVDVLDTNLIRYVNPLVGTSGAGQVFPGAVYPFGMIQWSPDTSSMSYSGGYKYEDKEISGFSLTHFSGGGLVTGMHVPIMPYVGEINISPAVNPGVYHSTFSHASEKIEPGYYEVLLDGPKTKVEISVTERTGIARFTFPSSVNSKILINKGGASRRRTETSTQKVEILSDREVAGFAENIPNSKLYFYAIFDRPFNQFGVWDKEAILYNTEVVTGTDSGSFVNFDTTENQEILMRVGISYVSIENARENLISENKDWNIESVKNKASKEWNEKLSKIQIKAPDNEKEIFYTALYHSYLHPSVFSDVNGEYIGLDNQVHLTERGEKQYHYFSNWDMYRTHVQLISILEPNITSDMMQSLINFGSQGNNTLPIWQAENTDLGIMGGDNGIPVVSSAFAFGVNDFDTSKALDMMTNSKSRSNNPYYIKQGYLSIHDSYRAVSENMEFSTDNFSTATFANGLGMKTICSTYLERSSNWMNLFDKTIGFVRPRNNNGDWTDFDPSSQKYLEEGDSWIYTFMVPHDLNMLMSELGGKNKAIQKLNTLFNTKRNYMQNEAAFVIPWVYTFWGEPEKTAEQLNKFLNNFTSEPEGLPENDDAGALSAWYIFSRIGLYPAAPGLGGFIVGTPSYERIKIELGDGKSIVISANKKNRSLQYVKNLYLNKSPFLSVWLPWDKIKNGASLNFELAESSANWGKDEYYLPPKFSSDLCIQEEALIEGLYSKLKKIIN